MSDPIQKPVVVRNSLTVIGPIGAATLVTTGLATLASANIQSTAVVGTSLIVSGPVTGASFSGIGTSLTALNASNLSSGTVPIAQLGISGAAGATTFLRGDNSWSSAVTAVTVVAANGISGSVATQGTTPAITLTLGAITPTSVNASGSVTAASFSGVGTSLTALNASNITSGTVAPARLGSGVANSSVYLRGDGFWAIPSASGDISVTTVSSSGLGTFGSLSVNGASTLNTLTVNSSTTLASLTVNTNANFSAGFTANGSASVGGSLSVGGALTSGDISGTVFIPTSNTVPTYGVYKSDASGGVGISTGNTERLSVSATGIIKQSGPVVRVINTLTSPVVDCSKGNYFKRTYTSAQTWSFINVPTGVFYSFILRITRSGSAAAQTWPSAVKWTGGTTPTLTNTNGGSDIFEFMTDDGGTSWRAFRRTTTTT